MKYEESFGIIPVKKTSSLWEVFLIQHNKGHYWGFPKGHAEEGETPIEAAIRELKEETNLDVIDCLKKDPFIEQYQFTVKGERVLKRVSYFLAEVSGVVILQSMEIQNGLWVSLDQAIEKMTHTEGKSILTQVIAMLASSS
jgi:bis(5'-nucleosidyl)-tetraphosphatase